MSHNNLTPGIPDILAKGLDVVFCGINPGMRSALLGQHFAGRGNRFWPVLHASGFTPKPVVPENARALLTYRCGITSAVERPTVAASELKRADFIEGRAGLEQKIRRYRPRFIAFLGKAACSAILDPRGLCWGPQTSRFDRARVWLLPNPSGLNCAFTIQTLTAMYHQLYEALSTKEKLAPPLSKKPVSFANLSREARTKKRSQLMSETLQFFVNSTSTPIGDMFIVTDTEGNLRATYWTDEARMTRVLRQHYGPKGFTLEPGKNSSPQVDAINRYFAGELAALNSLRVKTAGTPFQSDVWKALREIPCGTTISYSTLARRIGRPAAVRAVGLANGSNPIGVVVPCHRVIGADGSLTGYGGGIERKRWLLRHESAQFSADNRAFHSTGRLCEFKQEI